MEGSGQLCTIATFILREGCTISNWIGGQVVFGTNMSVGAKSHKLYIQVLRFGQQLLNWPVVFFWVSVPCID